MWAEELGTCKMNREKNEVERIIRVEQRRRMGREEWGETNVRVRMVKEEWGDKWGNGESEEYKRGALAAS
jgi:hypothetical protein